MSKLSNLTALRAHLKSNKKIDPDTGCWIWQGWINKEGYGRLQWGKKKYLAHRLSAVAFTDYKLSDYDLGFQVNHLCHNRACINPEHFYIGTQEENMQDLDTKLEGVSLLRRMTLAVYVDELADDGEVKLTYEIYNSGSPVPMLNIPHGCIVLGMYDVEIPPVKE